MCVDSYLCLAWTSVVGKETACFVGFSLHSKLPSHPGVSACLSCVCFSHEFGRLAPRYQSGRA